MAADTQALAPARGDDSGVKNWLTATARPWAARKRAQARESATVKSVPGVVGLVCWVLAIGGIVTRCASAWFGVHGLGPWVSAAVLGYFMTRLDSRIG